VSGKVDTIEFRGLPALQLSTRGKASAVLSLYGGQLLSWVPAGGRERLYLSETAVYDQRTPIRGGVPVCFPQFAERGALPRHGFARTAQWTVTEQRAGDDYALATLCLTDNAATRALWPHAFELELTVAIEGGRLDLELEVRNTGHAPFAFTAALHTYLRVSEVEDCRLEGLYGFDYTDCAQGATRRRESGDALVIEGETDRIYHDVQRPLLLRGRDPALGINADGFPDVVVWNPWETTIGRFADMQPADFRRMLCVEAAAAHQRVELGAGESWFGRQSLVVL
jgi:glucose-6-phosphate 1-epimerase